MNDKKQTKKKGGPIKIADQCKVHLNVSMSPCLQGSWNGFLNDYTLQSLQNNFGGKGYSLTDTSEISGWSSINISSLDHYNFTWINVNRIFSRTHWNWSNVANISKVISHKPGVHFMQYPWHKWAGNIPILKLIYWLWHKESEGWLGMVPNSGLGLVLPKDNFS